MEMTKVSFFHPGSPLFRSSLFLYSKKKMQNWLNRKLISLLRSCKNLRLEFMLMIGKNILQVGNLMNGKQKVFHLGLILDHEISKRSRQNLLGEIQAKSHLWNRSK